MLRSADSLIGYKLLATDGALGKVKDLYFDDRAWAVRYIVVDTGGWLSGRRVLVSPVDVGKPDWSLNVLQVEMTKKQIEDSPVATEDRPVSRQYEEQLSRHFGWPSYWVAAPGAIPAQSGVAVAEMTSDRADGDTNPHLRSTREVMGYHIQASDGEIGHVKDLVVDTELWMIRYLVVDTRNWLPGRKVLVDQRWIDAVSWEDRTVSTDLRREDVKESPEYNSDEPVNRQYETRLYDYYGRPAYWK